MFNDPTEKQQNLLNELQSLLQRYDADLSAEVLDGEPQLVFRFGFDKGMFVRSGNGVVPEFVQSEVKGQMPPENRDNLVWLKEYWEEHYWKLPYVLDLMYDVKSWSDVMDVMNGRPTRCGCTLAELEELALSQGYYL